MDEQSEYYDATENPLLKDKRQDQDDEDSGVDNASQILRETSVSSFNYISLFFPNLDRLFFKKQKIVCKYFCKSIVKYTFFNRFKNFHIMQNIIQLSDENVHTLLRYKGLF